MIILKARSFLATLMKSRAKSDASRNAKPSVTAYLLHFTFSLMMRLSSSRNQGYYGWRIVSEIYDVTEVT